jgi:hypothetical protein
MAQRKETNKKVKVRDLKPKKDAKGGRVPPGGHAVDRSSRASNQQMTKVWGG